MCSPSSGHSYSAKLRAFLSRDKTVLEMFLSSTSGSWISMDLDSRIFTKPQGLLAFPLQAYEFLHQSCWLSLSLFLYSPNAVILSLENISPRQQYHTIGGGNYNLKKHVLYLKFILGKWQLFLTCSYINVVTVETIKFLPGRDLQNAFHRGQPFRGCLSESYLRKS